MIGVRGLARTMLSAVFLFGALSAWKRAPELAAKAKRISDPIAKVTGLPLTGQELVRLNAGIQLSAGTLFALGIQQRAMALVLAGTLVPTTLAGHPYWDAAGDAERSQQQIHFLKNLGLMGGLVFAALDTGGRPSVFWLGRRKASELADSISATTQSVGRSVSEAIH